MKESVTNQAETEKEESEEYSLVSALPERGERQGEFWLYDKNGEVLQRIPQGILQSRLTASFTEMTEGIWCSFPMKTVKRDGYWNGTTDGLQKWRRI